ncbi:MAG: FAD-binding protein [Verrucomicrobiales bacterium]
MWGPIGQPVLWGAQVKRTFYAAGQTGQQLLIGCYQALSKEIAAGGVKMYPRTEMLDVVVVDGHAKGIVVRDLQTGEISTHAGDAVILATGGYGNVFYLSTNAMGCNVTAAWRAHRKGLFRQSLLHPNSSHLHSGQWRIPKQADPDVGVASQ